MIYPSELIIMILLTLKQQNQSTYHLILLQVTMMQDEVKREAQRLNRRDRKKLAVEEQNRLDLEKIQGQLNQLIIDHRQLEQENSLKERRERERKPREQRQIKPRVERERKPREERLRMPMRQKEDKAKEQSSDSKEQSEDLIKQLEQKGFVVVSQKKQRHRKKRGPREDQNSEQIKKIPAHEEIGERGDQKGNRRQRRAKKFSNEEWSQKRDMPSHKISFEQLQIDQQKEEVINPQPYRKNRQNKDRNRERKPRMQKIEPKQVQQVQKAENKKVKDKQNPPEYFMCPITQVIMQSPVILTSCGHTFEQSIIREWLKKQLQCPLCKRGASQVNIIKNFALAEAITSFK